MNVVSVPVAAHVARQNMSESRMWDEVIPKLFAPKFVEHAKTTGNESLLVDVGRLYMQAKLKERERLSNGAAEPHEYSTQAHEKRARSEWKFTDNDFHFVCTQLGMGEPGVVEGLFQSINVEVDDVLTAQQVFEWITVLFGQANAPETGARTDASAPTSPVHPEFSAVAQQQRQANFAYQFLDYGHSGRLRTRHIAKAVKTLVGDVARIDLDTDRVTSVLRGILGAGKSGQGRPRRDSTLATSAIESGVEAAEDDAEASSNAAETKKDDDGNAVEAVDDSEAEVAAEPEANTESSVDVDLETPADASEGEKWSSVVLHPAAPRDDDEEVPLTRETYVDLMTKPAQPDGSIASRVPQVHVAAISALGRARTLPARCLQLRGRLVREKLYASIISHF